MFPTNIDPSPKSTFVRTTSGSHRGGASKKATKSQSLGQGQGQGQGQPRGQPSPWDATEAYVRFVALPSWDQGPEAFDGWGGFEEDNHEVLDEDAMSDSSSDGYDGHTTSVSVSEANSLACSDGEDNEVFSRSPSSPSKLPVLGRNKAQSKTTPKVAWTGSRVYEEDDSHIF